MRAGVATTGATAGCDQAGSRTVSQDYPLPPPQHLSTLHAPDNLYIGRQKGLPYLLDNTELSNPRRINSVPFNINAKIAHAALLHSVLLSIFENRKIHNKSNIFNPVARLCVKHSTI